MNSIYENGSYLANNPSWHQEDSKWKASNIKAMLIKHQLTPKKIGEIGCGAGEILNQLSKQDESTAVYVGYEIAREAYEKCAPKTSPNLTYIHGSLPENDPAKFDVLLVIDVFEHIEDYLGFLKKIKTRAGYKIFHIPLDLSVQTVLRSHPLANARKSVGHIHYFTKETALATLEDTGYEIIDYVYTRGSLELPSRHWKAKLLQLPRRIFFALNQDLAARILGGFSLLVLAK